jgi:hypothetical protein
MVLKALEGNYKPEQVFVLTQAVKIYDYYGELMKECDQEIDKILTLLSLNKPQQTLKNKTKPVRYNKPEIQDLHQKLINITEGKDPTGIAGITSYSFLQLLAEFGNDLSRWPTEKHFVSWLKLAPVNSNSGKVNRKLKIKNRSKGGLLFRNIAQGLLTSKHIGIGSFGRKIRAKKGSPVAVKAVARKLACYYYRVMTKGIEYVEKGIEWYEAHLEQKSKKYLEKLALKHNMLLVAAQE